MTTITRITANGYGNIEREKLPDPMPDGQIVVPKLPARRDRLEAAGVEIIRVVEGFRRNRYGAKPILGDYVIDADWQAKLDEWKMGEGAAAQAAASAKAKEAAKKAARTRKINKLADESPYVAMLVQLEAAHDASEDAKSKAANSTHRLDWQGPGGSYTISREAVHRAYRRREAAIARASQLLTELDLSWGWGHDPSAVVAPHVLYIDLPTGQVSFHTPHRGQGPTYPGEWDGVPSATGDRITAAINQQLADEQHP